MPLFKNKIKDWPIARTISGKNSVGKKLNKILPLKKQREVVGQVIRGVADVAPIANAKDASLRKKAEVIKQRIETIDPRQTKGEMQEAIKDIYDLLDDGQLNDSAELTPELRQKIRMTTSILVSLLVIYEILAVLFGWPSVLAYLPLILG